MEGGDFIQSSKGVIELRVPGSKSLSHRAFLSAAMAEGRSTVSGALMSQDTLATLGALSAFGVEWSHGLHGEVSICGRRRWRAPSIPIDCRNSGTTLRLFLAQAARFDSSIVFSGDESLQSRPNGPLLASLSRLGVRCGSLSGVLPITIEGPCTGKHTWVEGVLSSQFASGLCFLGAALDHEFSIELRGPLHSWPYLELTIDTLKTFGAHLELDRDGDTTSLKLGRAPLVPTDFSVEGDWSSAAFPLVASLLSQRDARLMGLNPDSLQGDREIVRILKSFGAELRWSNGVLECTGGTLRSPGVVTLTTVPDLFPIVASLASAVPGRTKLIGPPGLRAKECDRISAMAEGLHRLGVQVTEQGDTLVIVGGAVQAGSVDTRADHRIEMAFRVLGLVAQGEVKTNSLGAEVVSYPEFGKHFANFGD